jgi:hypothetical protein
VVLRVMGREEALKVVGKMVSRSLREEAMGMAMEPMAMGMAWEAMETGKMGEDRLRWPITTLLSFSQHGTPLPQIRLRITLSRKPLVVVQPRMCMLLP